MSRSRVVALVVSSSIGLALTVALLRLPGSSPPAPPGPPGDLHRVDAVALRVLHGWDARRATAWSSGSPRRLGELYVPGSGAGSDDVRLLERYRARGFRVVAMATQVLALSVVAGGDDRWTLRVTDRLERAVAVRAGERTRLPRDGASTRVLTLMRSGDGRWRMAGVTRVGPAA